VAEYYTKADPFRRPSNPTRSPPPIIRTNLTQNHLMSMLFVGGSGEEEDHSKESLEDTFLIKEGEYFTAPLKKAPSPE